MAGRDGAERAGVIDEARGPGEPGRLGDGRTEPEHGIGSVEEPPRCANKDGRVEAG